MGVQVGAPLVTSSLPLGKQQHLACSRDGNVSGALLPAGTELKPQNSPLGPTCVGGCCPEHVPTCSHPVMQQGLGRPKQWWGRQGYCGVERGHGRAGMCPLSLRPVCSSISYKHREQRRQHPAASLPVTPVPPCSRMDLWLSQASQSSQLSPDNLHWPDLAPGSHPGTSWTWGPL